jgi:hypothetical protein
MERTVERPPIRVIALRWQREWVVKSLANWSSAIGYPALRSWLFEGRMVMTVESYWPYATTLFDYVRRAMPFQAPGSLTADEIYAVLAYILAEGNVTDKAVVLDAETLPRVQMPNRDGFIPDPRPELFK